MAWSSRGASARVGDCEGSCTFPGGETKGNSSGLLVSLSYLVGRFLRHLIVGLGV